MASTEKSNPYVVRQKYFETDNSEHLSKINKPTSMKNYIKDAMCMDPAEKSNPYFVRQEDFETENSDHLSEINEETAGLYNAGCKLLRQIRGGYAPQAFVPPHCDMYNRNAPGNLPYRRGRENFHMLWQQVPNPVRQFPGLQNHHEARKYAGRPLVPLCYGNPTQHGIYPNVQPNVQPGGYAGRLPVISQRENRRPLVQPGTNDSQNPLQNAYRNTTRGGGRQVHDEHQRVERHGNPKAEIIETPNGKWIKNASTKEFIFYPDSGKHADHNDDAAFWAGFTQPLQPPDPLTNKSLSYPPTIVATPPPPATIEAMTTPRFLAA
jgi:hypothetical protein